MGSGTSRTSQAQYREKLQLWNLLISICGIAKASSLRSPLSRNVVVGALCASFAPGALPLSVVPASFGLPSLHTHPG